MGEIKAICISEKRGTQKHAVEEAVFVTEHGIKDDAHAGDWHRQVSFLGWEEIEEFRHRGAQVELGAFGENVVAEAFCFKELPVGTRLRCGSVFFEITQIGKKCHSHCAIHQQVGDCIMPREGVFARVLHGGTIRKGDMLEIAEDNLPLEAAIITASDKGSRGEREDKSGDRAEAMLKEAGYEVVHRTIVPDEKTELVQKMKEFADEGIALVVTTGGTGFSVRDVTPEATLEVCERLAPGIPEAMRALSMKVTPRAMLSRAVAGIRKRTLIVNLPGSAKAVKECLGFVLPELRHGIDILRGEAGECGRK
ncbi:MAG: molybdenum cofactor biosynthesis protein [Selenomonadaceae bacterium]|nr:molybdenum cofactor biosynthesis protein [Selenomonadaceae bacterium]